MPGGASCLPGGTTARKHRGRADTPTQPLQQTLKDPERAYANFFAQRADPKQVRLDQTNSRLFLPKLGRLRCARHSRP